MSKRFKIGDRVWSEQYKEGIVKGVAPDGWLLVLFEGMEYSWYTHETDIVRITGEGPMIQVSALTTVRCAGDDNKPAEVMVTFGPPQKQKSVALCLVCARFLVEQVCGVSEVNRAWVYVDEKGA